MYYIENERKESTCIYFKKGAKFMFKKLLESLNKENYKVTIEEGRYIIREKDTGRDYYSISCNDKGKEIKLIECYNNILTKKLAK